MSFPCRIRKELLDFLIIGKYHKSIFIHNILIKCVKPGHLLRFDGGLFTCHAPFFFQADGSFRTTHSGRPSPRSWHQLLSFLLTLGHIQYDGCLGDRWKNRLSCLRSADRLRIPGAFPMHGNCGSLRLHRVVNALKEPVDVAMTVAVPAASLDRCFCLAGCVGAAPCLGITTTDFGRLGSMLTDASVEYASDSLAATAAFRLA